MNTKKNFKIYILPILCIGLLTAFDQLTKFMVKSSFALYESRPLIKGVFHLTYIQNTGIAWGMFKDKRTIFLMLTVAVLIFCACFYAKIPDEKRFRPIRICLVFLVSGAIGNMIDRITLHYVVDFFDFCLIHFPIFNVADIYVTCSMLALILLTVFYYKEEDLEVLFPSETRKQSGKKRRGEKIVDAARAEQKKNKE